MATARKLLNEASKSFEVGLSSQIEEFLEGAEKKKLKHEEAKLYSGFIQNCLHKCMTRSKNVQDKVEVEEILKTAVVCAQASRHLQTFLELDKTHIAPSLLYHLLHNIQDKAFTYLEYVVKISEIVYVMLDDVGCPDTSHTILAAFHSILWNCTSKHLKQGTSQSLKDDLTLQKLSLQFLCCTPINPARLCLLLQTVIAYYSQFNRTWIDKGTSEMYYSIFQCIVDKLQTLSDGEKSVESISVYRFVIYRVQALLIEYLLSMSDFEKAREVIGNLKLSCRNCPLYDVLMELLSHAVIASEAFKNSQQLDISSEKLQITNNELRKLIQTESCENLKLVFRSLECFLQPFTSKVYDNLDISLVKVLLGSCEVLQWTYAKLEDSNNWDDNTKDTKKKSKDVKKQSWDDKKVNSCEMPAKKQDYVQGCCQIYYKQLTLFQKMLDADTGVEIFRECVDTSQKFTKFLDDNSSWLTEKSLQSKRYNIGCVCNMIGAVCIQAKHYMEAASLYTIVIEQFHSCGQPNLIKMFEKLLECYMLQEKWMEAIQTIVHAFTAIDDSLKHIATVWTRLRKEASSKDAIFQSMTLNSVIKSSEVDLKGVSSKQLLLAEYHAWKQNSRRQFDMEYPVFVELLENTDQTPSEKAEAMVALASNICITGYKYNNMSACELLNKAIIALDKNLAGFESTMAVACYTKYAILHEEAIEYMKNKSGDLEYFGTADLSASSRYTLQQEQENLPFLVRAIEMWEKSFCPKAQKSGKKVCKKEVVIEEKLFGLDHHIDNLILCGTRLIAMKQPQLALRALQVAKDQISNVEDTKTASELSLQVTRSLMLLGRYKEAESVMDGTGDGKKNGEATNAALLLSELYMLTGKRETGLQILQSFLDSNVLLGKTHKVYFMQGTAKRLLSMALCLPGGDHMIGFTNQYLLSLAFESVHCHVTVLNFLTQNKTFDRNTNKWLILNEILASMLHVCQLCRFVGLPREALCYLKSGLNISQGQGLPRWSCEFLMEMLGVQSMEGECDKALSTAESLDCILNPDIQLRDVSVNQSMTESKRVNQSADNESAKSSLNQDGYDSVQIVNSTMEKTPERAYVKQELDSTKKNKMKELRVPRCCCMVGDCDLCTDLIRHRLCMKAGVVLSDFLAQSDMRSTADQLLKDVQSKFEILKSYSSDFCNSVTGFPLPNEMSVMNKDHIQDPQLLYSCLEAGCIKAESHLHKKEFQKVHNIWTIFQNLEKSGCLKNVLHSNILLTRLALCDASGYMLSLSESETKLNQSRFNTGIEEIVHNVEKMSINSRRKVSFEGEGESWSVTGTCVNLARKMAKFADDVLSPVKQSVLNTFNTPVSKSVTKMPLTTPSNRMMVQVDISDDEDDIIVFPECKPVTPAVLTKSSKISRMKSKTEPRNLIHKKPAFKIAEDPVDESVCYLACKLNFLPQSTDDTSVTSVEEESLLGESKGKPKKQGEKEKCSSTSSSNESVDTVNTKRKSGSSKRLVRKQASIKTKDPEHSVDSCSDDIKKGLNEKTENDTEVLKEKKMNKDDALSGKVGNTVDVFDFDLEASPIVTKVTKTGKGRQTKGGQRGKKASGLSRKPLIESDEKEVDNKENSSASKNQKTTRRGRAKRETNTVERVRKNSYDLDKCELEISLEELTFDNNSFSNYHLQDSIVEAEDLDFVDQMIEQDDKLKRHLKDIEVKVELDLEPIEIMRGETVKKGSKKGGKRTGRRVKTVPKTDAAEEKTAENTECNDEANLSGDDSSDRRRSVEKMRSGRLCSMNELTHADLMDMPSCIEETEPECSEPSGSDIISTMETLYERLCKFPPNPQHSDVCHILALHYFNTDPLRAAFLLCDAMAVTFRHQVILNLDKKARREAKSSVASASKRASVPEESLLFSGEDLKLRDMVKSIPEGWCVAQLSVVSVGLPCKQMILTRFVKDEDPVILKLPGFSSPQGRHVLKDFSTILENNAESAKIELTREWWDTRRKLDNDMESVVDRMEKHLLGHWRCAVTAGEFQDKILQIVCKEISNITGKDVRKAHTEMLLMAHKIVTEKEMGQCFSDLLGENKPTIIEKIISVLKKYTKLNIGNEDKLSHTILILDKTIQHLPWESIPVLSDKSVSRMPCLSHLVTQLNNHYKGKNSVFVKGVNLRNTFYILNPDSDLPRTQEFFKEWFESEKGWSGVIGCRPSSEQFIDALTKKDFLIFCGHGSGGRIFSSDEIEKLTARAVTMLMGCSSGRLHVKGQLEPTGMMISYFLAGCPSMVANLWDVTDKDIDKFTEDFIKTWMSSCHGTYLTTLVQKSRSVCKLKYLNGLAPVVYGLPVFINKGKK